MSKESEQARKTDRKTGRDLATPAQANFQGQRHHKNQRRIVILSQWIEIEVDNGQAITKLYPSNETLVEECKAMLPAPDLVYRRLNFPGGVPPEYHWVTRNPEARERGGTGIQRMTIDTWLHLIERERGQGTGHVGPTGIGNLPRPSERGVCECAVCRNNEVR
ncbi:MAG: hypothetical protein ACJ74Z_04610 [Bryobacteraceae bacterium]